MPQKIVNNAGELERLSALYELNILDTPAEERFDRITRLAASIMNVSMAYISFIDENRQWFKSVCGLSLKETPRDVALCSYTIQQNTPLIVPDALLDSRFADNPLVVKEPYIRFYASYPLSAGNGQKVGALCIADRNPYELNAEQLELFKTLASIVEDELKLIDIAELQGRLRTVKTELEQTNQQLVERNKFIEKTLGCYISDDLISELLKSSEQLQLGGQRQEITILFSDLRNFTRLSETLEPEILIKILNRYFSTMVDIILKYKGVIDSFIGDSIMVLFSVLKADKDDTLRAVACAIEMQLAMKALNHEFSKEGLPELSMGIGINTGDAIVGNIGSLKHMKYSAIGASVNLASRIEDFCIEGQILISAATLQKVKNNVEINGHLRVKLKGIMQPTTLYDIIGVKGLYNLSL